MNGTLGTSQNQDPQMILMQNMLSSLSPSIANIGANSADTSNLAQSPYESSTDDLTDEWNKAVSSLTNANQIPPVASENSEEPSAIQASTQSALQNGGQNLAPADISNGALIAKNIVGNQDNPQSQLHQSFLDTLMGGIQNLNQGAQNVASTLGSAAGIVPNALGSFVNTALPGNTFGFQQGLNNGTSNSNPSDNPYDAPLAVAQQRLAQFQASKTPLAQAQTALALDQISRLETASTSWQNEHDISDIEDTGNLSDRYQEALGDLWATVKNGTANGAIKPGNIQMLQSKAQNILSDQILMQGLKRTPQGQAAINNLQDIAQEGGEGLGWFDKTTGAVAPDKVEATFAALHDTGNILLNTFQDKIRQNGLGQNSANRYSQYGNGSSPIETNPDGSQETGEQEYQDLMSNFPNSAIQKSNAEYTAGETAQTTKNAITAAQTKLQTYWNVAKGLFGQNGAIQLSNNPQDLATYEYLQKNPNDPHYAAGEARLKAKYGNQVK